MADNGNSGPNDASRRSGRRRREPPIIDASATEVRLDRAASDDAPGSEVSGLAPASPSATVEDALPMTRVSPSVAGAPEGEASFFAADRADVRETVPSDAPVEPVLFGSAARDPMRHIAAGDEPSSLPGKEASAPAAGAAAPSDATRDADLLDPPQVGPLSPAGHGEQPPRGGNPAPGMAPHPGSGSNWLAGILGVASLILLGIIGWLAYSGGQREHDLAATLANLKTRVAALEARPDPAALQGQVAALDRRAATAETDRDALGKQVAALSARIDAAGQPASASAPDATAPADKPADTSSGQQPAGQQPAGQQPAGQQPAGLLPAAPALATMAAVAALATTVEGIDGRVTTLSAAQTETEKAVAGLPKPVLPDFGPVNASVAALGAEVNAVDSKINGSDARLNGFDAKINGIDARVNGFGTTMNTMTARMNGLEARVEDGAAETTKLKADLLNLPKVDLGPLRAATSALDDRVGKVEGELAAPKDGARVTEARAVGSADEAKATPIALVGEAIQRAIAAGKPYGPEIDALKALGADPALVARLGPASADGAPSLDTLTSRWDAARGQVLATMKPIAPGAGGTFNRFLAGASSIVQVRRVGAAPGEDTNALVGQIDAALGRDDVAAALAAWDKLPPAGQTASQPWAEAARSRVNAAAAAGDLVQGAIATLGRSPS